MNEKHLDHTVNPEHCFCQIPQKDLQKWADKRYHEDYSTIELLDTTSDPYEKEVISIVALLDADEETLVKSMGKVDKPEHHVIECRRDVKNMLDGNYKET